MDAIIEQSSDTRITRIVDEITNTLERGELRLRPFSNVPHDATKEQLRTFAAAEVGRSIERVRMKLPSEPSDADARQAIKALDLARPQSASDPRRYVRLHALAI